MNNTTPYLDGAEQERYWAGLYDLLAKEKQLGPMETDEYWAEGWQYMGGEARGQCFRLRAGIGDNDTGRNRVEYVNL